MSVWRPSVFSGQEFSNGQMWVIGGSGPTLESVEAGWIIYPQRYGDDYPRFFIFFTNDAYATGCYDLDCGFIQTNGSLPIGGRIDYYSTVGGPQRYIKPLWFKDGTTGSWWLQWGSSWIGYYPRSLFDTSGLANEAGILSYGGEVVDSKPWPYYFTTQTDMGSGRYAAEGWTSAAWIAHMRYIDTSNYVHAGDIDDFAVTRSDCWSIKIYSLVDDYFYYGGPGFTFGQYGSCMP